MFIVNKGQVHVFKENSDGEQVTLGLVNSGEYLGEVAVFGDKNHQASAEALSDVECIEISSKAIHDQMKTAPTWLIALTRGLVDRLIRTNETLRKHNLVDPALSDKVKNIKSKFAEADNE